MKDKLPYRQSECDNLIKSEERYKHITDTVTDYIYTVHVENRYPVETIHTSSCFHVTGYTVEEFEQNPYLWIQMVYDEDREIVKNFAKDILSGKPVRPVEHRIVKKDKTIRWIRNTPVLHFNKKGNLLFYDGLVQDITEKKITEELLHYRLAIEELVTTISTYFINISYEEINTGINAALQSMGECLGVDRAYILLISNKKVETVFEWYQKELLSMSDIFTELSLGAFPWMLKKLNHFECIYIPQISDLPEEAKGEKDFYKSIGIRAILLVPLICNKNIIGILNFTSEKREKIWLEEDIRIVKLLGEMFVNVLERKRADEELKKYRNHLEELVEKGTEELIKANDQLVRSERLAATGHLAASIAHEINSPLQAITVLLSNLRNTYKEDILLYEHLDLLRDAFNRIRDTVKNLLDLSRPEQKNRQYININIIIKNIISLMESHLKANKVKVALKLSDEIPPILASPLHLGQVFMNIINNSVEAMCGSSSSMNLLSLKSVSNRDINIKTDICKNNIIIIISDTGPGIPDKDLEHIFDPFYSRKKKMGIGIGLSICHTVINEHNGSIEAKNSPDGGAVFNITIPLNTKKIMEE